MTVDKRTYLITKTNFKDEFKKIYIETKMRIFPNLQGIIWFDFIFKLYLPLSRF